MPSRKLSIRPIKILGAFFAVLYPIAIFIALRHGFSVRVLGVLLGCVALVGVARQKSVWLGVSGLLLACMAVVSNGEIFLKLYPVFMNAIVTMIFAVSLSGVPVAQKIAEKMKYKMTDDACRYARNVTLAWAIFMGVNTIVSLVTVFMPNWVWTLYNGLVSYCLIGLMFLVEYFVRRGVLNEHK